jgi:ABC-type polysaccharide/polyol phosphate transport system ATPase subunit
MNASVIHAESLSKLYRRGLNADPGLRHALERAIKSPLSVFRRARNETFFALKDVSLDVREGEVLGLIGRNGAGKTTLLKILSRITRPTSGWAEIHGRVGSLLEVGTGFHPELTGRENTFLSGAILGMGKSEIARKFDEIVAFAELEKFIDTPVKHYSSGMYVRLAFAVAAHLEPEILLVDEVLAVGDINFQKKCLGKMGDVARAGRTVVLVTHQLNQIRRLCHRVLWIDAGSIRQSGPTHEVTASYESAMTKGDSNGAPAQRPLSTGAQFVSWELTGASVEEPHTLAAFGEVIFKVTARIARPITLGHHGIALFNSDSQLVWGNAIDGMRLEPGLYDFCHTFKGLPLRPGSYSWRVSLYDGGILVDAWDCLPPMIVATTPLGHPRDEWAGVLNLADDFTFSPQQGDPK